MKGSSRLAMKDESASAAKSRIGTRSTGRVNVASSKSPRTIKSASSSPSTPVPRRLRSLSPGTTLGKLRAKKARLENDKDTPRPLKSTETTPKHATPPNTDQGQQGSQSSQNTPKGAGIRTRLSTGSIQMNGTMTISAAKEKAEIDQIMKQIAKSDTVVATKTPTSGVRKRVVQPSTMILPNEALLTDHPPPKKRKIGRNDGSGEDNCNDYFCWLCHKEGMLVCCELCPRVYHTRCLGLSAALPQDWVCPECEKIMRAECVDTRSKAMEMLTLEQLCILLKYALERMKHAGSEPFQKPVDLNAVPNYSDYIFHPMDLTTLEKNIKKKMYGCTEALLADAKWILHNCIIYNGAHSKFTSSAKMIVKICKHEMNEIELCPDCYLNSCVRKNDEWFSDTCRVPHTLVWAKLKGYPFWPSKALREVDGQVDVRFFGAHDRSWVSVSQCFLLSKNIPTSLQKGRKNNGLDMAIEELNLHVKKLREKFGGFEYAPFRTPYDKTDSYKPISLKPELSSKPNSVLRLSQNRESKIGTSSSFSSHKPNILRKSAVAKIRNKYSAMVTLKKLEMSPEKGKKRALKEEYSESDSNLDIEKSVEENVSEMTSGSENKNKEPSDVLDANEDSELANYLKETKSDEVSTKEKGIKKSFVSSNLIQQIENKLKSLVEEPVTEDNDTTENEVENLNEEKSKPSETKESGTKQERKDTDKTEKTSETGNDESKTSSETIKDTTFNAKSSEFVHVGEVEEACENKDNLEKTVNKKFDDLKVDTNKNEKESKDSYRKKLDTMIKSCKEKLGMDNDEAADIDSAVSDNEDDDSTDGDDDDSYSDEESGESESEEAVEKGKEIEEIEMEFESGDPAKGSEVEEKSKPDERTPENEKDEGSEKETAEQQKCETVSEDILTDESVKDSRKDVALESAALNGTSTQKCLSSESKYGKDSESVENKIIDLKTTETSEEKSEIVTSKANNSTDENQSAGKQMETANTSNKKEIDIYETESPKPVNSNNSSLHESSKDSNTAKLNPESRSGIVSSDEVKAGSGKKLDPLLGEVTNKTLGDDEDSDSDRLVIDLEDGSNKNQSKKITEVKHREEKHKTSTSGVVANPKADVININDETKKIEKKLLKRKKLSTEGREFKDSVDKGKNSGPESKEKSSGLTGNAHLNEPVDRSKSPDAEEKALSNNSVDRTQSNEPAEKTQSTDAREKMQSSSQADWTQPDTADEAQSTESPEKTQSTESPEKTKSTESPEKTQSTESPEKTQSNEPADKTQSNEPADKTQSNEPADKTQSNEQMDIDDVVDADDDDDLLEDFSSLPLEMESSLPLNMDSSLPDKNFVKPPNVDTVDEAPQSSKIAEKFSKKLMETIQKTVDEMCSEVMKEKTDIRTIELLNQKIAQARWNYCAELNELKHNFQLTMYEMKTGWESEKEQIVKTLTAKHHAEKELAIKEAKKKQWCAQCGKEAIFYCCWNTSYCDYPCQQNHWPQHMHTCLQTNKDKTASSNSSSSINQGQQGQGVSQSATSIPVSVGPSVTPQTSISGPTPPVETDHLRRLQDNLTMALHREEEKRGETRPGVSPKFNPPMSSSIMQNIRQPGPGSGGMMFNMQPQSQAGVMQQIQRTRFLGQQQMPMQVQQRSSLPQTQQQGNPRMLFSQPLIQQTVYPLQIQPQQQLAQQQLGGTILFQNPQQNLMTYGMPPRPY